MADHLAGFPYINDGRLRRVMSHWLEARSGALMPRRQDLDPVRLRDTLPYVWLADFDPVAQDLRFRLAGDEVENAYGTPLRGKPLNEVIPRKNYPAVIARYLRVAGDRVIYYATGILRFEGCRVRCGCRVVMPLSDDGLDVSGFLGAMVLDEKMFEAGRLQSIEEPEIIYGPIPPPEDRPAQPGT